MINITNVKSIFIKQIKDFRFRLIMMIPLFLLLIVSFIMPIFSLSDLHNLKGYENLLSTYSPIYPNLNKQNLLIIISFDINLLGYLIMITFMSPLFLTTEMIISEKENRTIENLFALPITDSEILLGKVSVSILTVFILIFSIYATTLISVYYNNMSFALSHLISFKWICAIFLFIPSLSFLMNLISIFISSKVNKMQTAQFITIIILIPAFVFFIFLSKGKSSIILDSQSFFIATVITSLISIIIFRIVIYSFNRENILLRY